VLGTAGGNVLGASREVQIPLLAALLIGGCAAKARRALSARSIEAGIGPTAVFPLRPAAHAIRSATALLFGTAVGALHELRARQPDAGCGCFGDLSDTPVSWRVMTRSALLCAAAIAAIGVPPLHRPASAGQALTMLAVAATELVVIAILSPEVGEIMVRLGHSEPCEVRRVPVSRTLAALHGSAPWRHYQHHLLATDPIDVWREECWQYAAFPGTVDGRRVEVVFAVYLEPRHPQVRAGIADPEAGARSRDDSAAAFPLPVSN